MSVTDKFLNIYDDIQQNNPAVRVFALSDYNLIDSEITQLLRALHTVFAKWFRRQEGRQIGGGAL